MKRRSLNKQQESKELKLGEAKANSRARKVPTASVELFQKKSYKCKNFFWKQSDRRNLYGQIVGPMTAYCRATDKSCKITNCPLVKK